MCNILKMADRRVKRMKVLGDSHYQELNICRVLFMSDSLSLVLGLFGALCKISDVKIFKRLNCFYGKYRNQGEYRVLIFW